MKVAEKILIVEDEAIHCIMLRKLLGARGFDISGVVATGEGAVDAVRHNPPDVILMDIQLAGQMNGIDAVFEIQKIRDIPVIFITGYPDEVIMKRALALHPVAYLTKPILIEDLIRKINSIAGDGRQS